MQVQEQPDGSDLAHILSMCNEAVAHWRFPVFLCGSMLAFNGGMVLIRILELWAEYPWPWLSTITWLTLFIHAAVSGWMFHELRLARARRQRWINVRHCCIQLARAETWSSREFFIEQTSTAIDRL